MKKIITLMLALIMVFAMAVPAFAIAVDSPKHVHDWSDWTEYDWGRERTCEECGIKEVEYYKETEENPSTGSVVSLGAAVLVSAAAVASFKRRK